MDLTQPSGTLGAVTAPMETTAPAPGDAAPRWPPYDPSPFFDELVGPGGTARPAAEAPWEHFTRLDPTNDKIVGSDYVTTAWGRDYADVSPLKGIVFAVMDPAVSLPVGHAFVNR